MEPAQRERMTLGAVVMRTVGPLRVRSPDSVDVLQPRVTLLWHNPSRMTVRVVVQSAVSSAVVAQAELDGERWTTPQALPPGDYAWPAIAIPRPPSRIDSAGPCSWKPTSCRTMPS
jgi:hypothetical protein